MSRAASFHLFSLPPELLESLTPRNLLSQAQPTSPPPSDPISEIIQSTTPSCGVCLRAVFTDVESQRSHFRSDWHRYNVKARLAGGKAVSETEFAVLLEGLEDSLSGSASSSSSDEESESDAIRNLLTRTRIQSRSPSPTDRTRLPVTAVAWFHSPPSTQIGVYRTIFTQGAQQNVYLSELKAMQISVSEGRKWAMFMVAGGHFAGLVARVSRPSEAETVLQKKQRRLVPEIEILRHKTFHRYTTRRKQGGSQSLNDQAKGNAKSAGALLRRYGEQALRDDIRNLIEEWAESISECERIWLRASGANRRIFIDYDGAIIAKGDERLRTFPFPTRRPTQAELSRCLIELTKVKVTHFTEEELQAQDAAYHASLPKPKPQPQLSDLKTVEKKLQPQKRTREEELLREKWLRFLDMMHKGRLESARTFWEREATTLGGVDATLPTWMGERASTLLQFAASVGQAEIVAWLLDDLHADPTIPASVPSGVGTKSTLDSRPGTPDDTPLTLAKDDAVTSASLSKADSSGRTAYDLASTRAVRDAFRRSAAAAPDAWDWFGAAHVPSALSAGMEAGRDEKKRKRREGLRERLRERTAALREEEERTIEEAEARPTTPVPALAPKTGPQRLGGAPMSNEGVAGLTPDMKARIERERRARAAEARLRGSASTK